MRIAKTFFAVLLFLLFLSPALWADKLALMIGINDYVFDDIPDLNGCENDVNLMRKLLITKYGFSPQNIKSILSGQATKENIVAAMKEWLIEKPKADDVVVFYYSGHGVQIPDKSGDEDDGFDEALCPTDMGPNESKTEFVNFLLDDELDGLLSQIPTENVTIVFDCCHSGTATKALGLVPVGMSKPKVVNRDIVLKPTQKPETVPANIEKPLEGSGRDLEDLGHVVITGCRDHEVSQERTWHSPEVGYFRSGVLTKNLTDVLNRSQSNLTYDELMENIRKNIGEGAVQTPQLHGKTDRSVFASTISAKPYALVTNVSGEQIALNVGSIHGVTKGSVYAVYPEDEVHFSGPRLGDIQILKVGLDTATATHIGGRPFALEEVAPISPMSRAVEIEHAFPEDSLYLRVDAYSDEANQFIRHLGVEDVVVVSDERRADFIVRIAPEFGRISGKLISVEGQVVLQLRERTVEELAEKFRRTIEREVLIKLLRNFQNPNPPFKLRVSVDREGNPRYQIGEALEMSFKAEKECYLILLNIDSEGYVTLMFPNKYRLDNRIIGGQKYTIPSSEMRFKIKASGPPGRELVMALATTKQISHPIFQTENQDEIFPDLTGAKLGTELRRILSESLRGRNTTGSSISIPTNEWVTDSLIVVITP